MYINNENSIKVNALTLVLKYQAYQILELFFFLDNMIVEGGGFEPWMSMLETPGGSSRATRLLANFGAY